MKRLFYLPAILISGLTIGYFVYKATGGPLSFHGWIANEYFGHPVGAFLWTIGGVAVAVTAAYTRTRNSVKKPFNASLVLHVTSNIAQNVTPAVALASHCA
jgi:hypothetical protein